MKLRYYILGGLLLVVGVGAVAYKFSGSSDKDVKYRTIKVQKGDLVQAVRATGTVQPVKDVQVGSQVSGRVIKLNADYNSKVKAGDIIAQIDPTPYEEKLKQDRAGVHRQSAEVEGVKSKLDQAEAELERDRELAQKSLVSESELDASLTTRNALAAQLKSARAALEQTRAAMRISQTNLEYTTIRAPVDGIVISRNVSEGQTIVANLNAQTIFYMATDLSTIQIQASIPEADIGKIAVGQKASFYVDAWPEIEFEGEVSQVRISATVVQNVVTYPVIITAANPEGKLFPGMTANVTVNVVTQKDALSVPNSALRFKPEFVKGNGKKPAPDGDEGKKFQPPEGPRVYVLEAGQLKPVNVTPGITDGAFTEIVEGALTPGQEVVVGVLPSGGSNSDTVNPFAPKLPGRGSRRPH